MGELFRRSCVAIVDTVRVAGACVVDSAGRVLVQEGLRIAFTVNKTTKREPNTCELKIYNLSETTRGKLQGKGAPVTLSAGYGSNAAVIFQGDSRTIDHLREGNTWVTRVRCGDGERVFQWARVSDSFAPGTSVVTVIKAVANALGINLGNLEAELNKGAFRGDLQTFAHGYTAHGKAALELDKLLRSVGLSWSIQDGALQVLRGPNPAPGSAVLLTPATGLIGSPEHEAPDRKGRAPLLRFKSLLQPQIKCGGTVELRASGIKGQFRVEAVQFTGDSAGTEWYSIGQSQAKPTAPVTEGSIT